MLVRVSVIVTVAPAAAAPLESLTVPSKLPLTACAELTHNPPSDRLRQIARKNCVGLTLMIGLLGKSAWSSVFRGHRLMAELHPHFIDSGRYPGWDGRPRGKCPAEYMSAAV